MFKTKGGGVNGFLNNVQKTADLEDKGTPNIREVEIWHTHKDHRQNQG